MNEEDIKVLIFNINTEYYAADIMEVERILGYKVPTKLPDSPDFVEGVINYEEKILPVISIGKKFNLHGENISDDSKIIVAKSGDERIGIIVDEVSEVKDIKSFNIENAPDIAASISNRYIKGLIKLDEKIIIFLRLASILSDEEKEEIMSK
ncbi:chemotaxis protein CheW [Clostridium sp. KNHs214]|uniref:chemotaxis protein CheW n=1 Tax=Clostridium sp. KNHs214 TaxID=1540257 RepID=UPI0005598F0C|nr:chemotaxis protein CheW [Clostridium sp. KNHs214]